MSGSKLQDCHIALAAPARIDFIPILLATNVTAPAGAIALSILASVGGDAPAESAQRIELDECVKSEK